MFALSHGSFKEEWKANGYGIPPNHSATKTSLLPGTSCITDNKIWVWHLNFGITW